MAWFDGDSMNFGLRLRRSALSGGILEGETSIRLSGVEERCKSILGLLSWGETEVVP